ncbi:MAG: NAD(+)/NADH kinase [Actinomycetota bacterium]|nr:NAD(+)/NADH kinase [Actinomycetota bacterium]
MGKIFRNIALLPHVQKEEAVRAARELARWLEDAGRSVRMLSEDAVCAGMGLAGMDLEELVRGLDLVVSLGGDGSMLRAAAVAYAADVPVVGVNLGKKGFLTAVDAGEMFEGMEDILAGRYLLQERMMLECSLPGDDARHFALNEVVVGKRELQRMIRLEVDIDGCYYHYYSGDGIIFSTPTGSTAYSLSSGGPIVDPLLDCIVLTPICSHSLVDRSVVVSPRSEIEVRVEAGRVMPSVSLDGREEVSLPGGGKIVVRRAQRRLKMIKQRGYTFYALLREKFDFPPGESRSY